MTAGYGGNSGMPASYGYGPPTNALSPTYAPSPAYGPAPGGYGGNPTGAYGQSSYGFETPRFGGAAGGIGLGGLGGGLG